MREFVEGEDEGCERECRSISQESPDHSFALGHFSSECSETVLCALRYRHVHKESKRWCAFRFLFPKLSDVTAAVFERLPMYNAMYWFERDVMNMMNWCRDHSQLMSDRTFFRGVAS